MRKFIIITLIGLISSQLLLLALGYDCGYIKVNLTVCIAALLIVLAVIWEFREFINNFK